MISQQHIIIQIIYGIAWILAVSLTTFGAFVSFAVFLSKNRMNTYTFEEVIRREIDQLPPKQQRCKIIARDTSEV
jgi:hypothetical protein